MEKLKVGTRITVLIVGGVIAMMLAILVGIRGIAQSNANLEALYHQRLESENRKVLYDEAMSNYAGSRNLMLGLGGFAILFASGLGIAICRSVTRPLKHVVGVSCNIAAGRLDNAIEVTGSNELTEMMAALRSMQATLREQIEAERRTAAENLRVRIALDNVSTGVMIANPEREIIYINHAAQKILVESQEALRTQLPHFDADKLIGQNIDQFHKNPQHQATLLSGLSGNSTASLQIGGRQLVVTASPVIDAAGQRLGTVAEWRDRTAEASIENEVADIVSAATMGDLSQRLNMAGKSGFHASLAEGLNQLLDNTQQALTATSTVLARLAQGDLTHTIDTEFGGIFGQLKDDTNATIDHLRNVVVHIKEAAEAINTASQEIAAGNNDLSGRTEEQASSLEETSSSMEQLNSAVRQNSESAEHACTLAKRSSDIGARGGTAVQKVVATMELIQTSSKKIGDIIGVIDSIAFQTNILALNAAVEAARAGDQGRGFAVVATEVRNLAQRSAEAAKEIKTLINTSNARVDEGVVLAGEAGETIDEVVTTFELVTALIEEIMNASREQSAGVGQVTQAVTQMDEVTQQNAALVEEAAAAAESLEEQARALVHSVAMFKLNDEAAPAGTSMLPGRPLRDATPKALADQRRKVGAGRTARPVARPANPRQITAMAFADEQESWTEF